MRRAAVILYSSMILATFAGCGGDSGSSTAGGDTSGDTTAACQAGLLGCDCLDGTGCWPGSDWICVEGTCREPECAVGDAGCGCFANGTCAAGLRCEGGVCAADDCPVGSAGCGCDAGACSGELVCEGGVCAPGDATCAPGSDGCLCGPERACDGALACVNNLCRAIACDLGSEGCYCGADFGCDDGLRCTADDRCEAIGCTPGNVGCACDDGACVGDGVVCDGDGRCQVAGCPEGAEGCACAPGDACVVTDGAALECVGGVCQASCTPGEPGCACLNGWSCGEGATCQGGVCLADGCTPGTEACGCAGGSCQVGLRCTGSGVCVDATGFIGGPCAENGSCERGGRCAGDVCVSCLLGSPGCGCDDGGACLPGIVCQAGTCIAERDLARQPPEDPSCYTPCRDGLQRGGAFVPCGSDGLMPGCVGGNVCVDGSCVADGEEPGGCVGDLDCPSFQACLEGRCYSQCETGDDCPDGMGCHMRVCRTPCASSRQDTEGCPQGTFCGTVDGENGFCLPQREQVGEPARTVDGGFVVTPGSVQMSNATPSGAFTLVNESLALQRFQIRKLNHTLFLADGSAEQSQRAPDGAVAGCDEAPCVCDDDAQCADDHRCELGACRPAGCRGDACPMFWLELGREGELERAQAIEVVVPPGAEVPIALGSADGSSGVRWQGTLEVVSAELGTQRLQVSYQESPEGRWTGTMIYLAAFGTRNLGAWAALPNPASPSTGDAAGTRDDLERQREVGNALVRRWGAFRRGRMSFEELQAVLTATRTGSWAFENVMEACPDESDACYLFDIGEAGVVPYTDDLNGNPIPTGVAELPFAVNLRVPDPDEPERLVGRIESSIALQYAGTPEVELRFHSDPGSCFREDFGACVVLVDAFSADVFVGGRYLPGGEQPSCADGPEGFQLTRAPWLVDGFVAGTVEDANGARYRAECRDGRLPFGVDAEDPSLEAANLSLAVSNPIPDGRTRRRTLTILDGALVNQSQLVLLFEERFESFLGDSDDDGFSAYGFVTLRRQGVDLNAEDANANDIPDVYEGAAPVDDRPTPASRLAITCSDDLLDRALPPGDALADNPDAVVEALIDGRVVGQSPTPINPGSDERVHVLCVDTRLFDGGLIEDPTPCPPESDVIFFTTPAATDLRDHPCQETATCGAALERLEDSGEVIQRDPVWRCEEETEVFCDANRLDLREGKVFFEQGEEANVFIPLKTDIGRAFRYKTRFINRSTGDSVGFAPDVCVTDGSDLIPYCYEPGLIEQLTGRVDCLLDIHANHYGQLSVENQARLNGALRYTFSQDAEPDGMITLDGFERLNAELLITLGDESFTDAFASRFDAAASRTVSFEGSLFERDGIDLAGVAGFEMYSLYRAAQHYQMVLDRFYALSPTFWSALDEPGARNFVTPDTIIRYFDKLIRASTQLARTWSEVSRRYQSFNRPDLARRVAQRAYAATYLESTVLSRLMLRVVDVTSPEERDQIRREVEDAQLRYRASLLEMQNVQSEIKDNLTLFGFAPDYIPFPALDTSDFRQSNGFEILLRRVQQKVALAAQREEAALNSDRAFETNVAQFQSELTQIRNSYENRLGDICGTFVGSDGRVRPAIEKYASFDERASLLGDPCGQMGNGELHNAAAQLELLQVDLATIRNSYETILSEVDIEQDRLAAQCDFAISSANYVYALQEGECHPTDPNCELPACPQIEGHDFGDDISDALLFNGLCINDNECHGNRECHGLGDVVDGLIEALDFFGFTPDEVSAFYDRHPVIGSCRFRDGVDYEGCNIGLRNLQQDIRESRFNVARIQQVQGFIAQAGLGDILSGKALVVAALEAGISLEEQRINETEDQITHIQNELAHWEGTGQCEAATIDSQARTRSMLLRLKELDLQTLRNQYQLRLNLANIERLRNTATRLQVEQREAEQLAVNITAARNDPNVRIYKNDAIINADIAFNDAIREAYKLTRVFEYYTSQSYAFADELFLIRLVSRGERNLENYVATLQNTFFEFEEFFGLPSNRVQLISLRDDIFDVPTLAEDNTPISQSARIARFRERLTDVNLLNADGYLTIPFSTRLEALSPLTRNHKVFYVEAEFIGSDIGDTIGRVYLRQKGTGVIHTLDDRRDYYRFDERTAVVNSFFNGNRTAFAPTIYQNYRLRDRPMVNSQWELVINQRDEQVNQDINLQSLTDIRLYVYYTDFTAY